MKKQKQKSKKKRSSRKKQTAQKKSQVTNAGARTARVDGGQTQKKPDKQRADRPVSRKAPETAGGGDHFPLKYISKAAQFLRETRMEMKKVKWPTRKELLASTTVVIVLTLIVALFLGIVDFGLIKIIKRLIG